MLWDCFIEAVLEVHKGHIKKVSRRMKKVEAGSKGLMMVQEGSWEFKNIQQDSGKFKKVHEGWKKGSTSSSSQKVQSALKGSKWFKKPKRAQEGNTKYFECSITVIKVQADWRGFKGFKKIHECFKRSHKREVRVRVRLYIYIYSTIQQQYILGKN